ncbi:MAG: hypothetical protein ACJ70W_09590 [Nitrososphaera sp.]
MSQSSTAGSPETQKVPVSPELKPQLGYGRDVPQAMLILPGLRLLPTKLRFFYVLAFSLVTLKFRES